MASPPSHLYVAEEDGGDPNVVSPAAALACPFPLGRGALPPSPSPSSAPSPSPSLTLPVVNDSVADAPASPASASLPRALRGAYIALRPGVTWRMMCTFFYASLITITAVVFMNAVQPFVFEQQLEVRDSGQQGSLLAATLVAQESTVIASAWLWGLLSDALGRRVVYAAGMALLAIGIALLVCATSLARLLIFRVVFALGSGAALAMLTALLADYPAEQSRGKSGGVIGLTAGLGALLALFGFLQIPKWLGNAGLSSSASATAMFGVVAGVLLLSAAALLWGLGPQQPLAAHASLLAIVKEGVAAARNPRLLLAYMAGFASRGDSVAITSFFSLWISAHARLEGLAPAAALARAGMISGIAQTMAIVGAPFVGVLADRVDRALTLTLAAVWALLAYALLFSLNAPEGVLVYVAAVAVGLGEIFMIVSAQVLIASEAPRGVRGSVSGLFSLLGSVSILVTSFLGGYLYDNWRPSAPFGLIALCNGLVVIVGVGVLVHSTRKGIRLCAPPRPAPDDTERKGLLAHDAPAS